MAKYLSAIQYLTFGMMFYQMIFTMKAEFLSVKERNLKN
jgi:hypothetical protein